MPGPGEYRPDPTEGITRIEDLPKPKVVPEGLRRVKVATKRCKPMSHNSLSLYILNTNVRK